MGAMGDLAGMGFWLFLAAVVVAGIWFDTRKRESQQETLRRIVESGQKVDQETIDKMLAAGGGSTRADRDLKVSGLIVMFVAPGLAILGWFLSKFNDKILIHNAGRRSIGGLCWCRVVCGWQSLRTVVSRR